MIKPILLYASPAWTAVRKTHRSKLQIFQNKTLRRITNAPWYVRNKIIHRDLNIESIDSAILSASHNYKTSIEKSDHDNLKDIISYDHIVEQKYKRPCTVHHDPSW